MRKVSEYFKFYRTEEATAAAADIALGKIAYIAGGKVIGQGADPTGSVTAYYRTRDANITAEDVAAWKTAFGEFELILGTYYSGPIPAVGGLFNMNRASTIYTPTGDTFDM